MRGGLQTGAENPPPFPLGQRGAGRHGGASRLERRLAMAGLAGPLQAARLQRWSRLATSRSLGPLVAQRRWRRSAEAGGSPS